MAVDSVRIETRVQKQPRNAGVTIQVSVGGATLDAIMVYVAPDEVAAILPSLTPIGTGTIKVTSNGVSATGRGTTRRELSPGRCSVQPVRSSEASSASCSTLPDAATMSCDG